MGRCLMTGIRRVLGAVLALGIIAAAAAQERCGSISRVFVYRQQRGPDYRVNVIREPDRYAVSYRYGEQRAYQRDSEVVRDGSGLLVSCVLPRTGGERRYDYVAGSVTVAQPGRPASTHTIETGAHPELLDAICAFVATGKDRERVLYIFDRETFATQVFVMSRRGTETATTPAGTFDCVKVKLALGFRAGLFFSLDFLVAMDDVYPFVVTGRTRTGARSS